MADRLYLQILDMTKIAGIVILVVIFIRGLFLSNKPKVISYALWGIVLFRLLCPVSVYSLMSALPELTPVGEDYSLKDLPVSFFDAGEAVYRAVGDVLNGGIGTQKVRTTLRANIADISDIILPAEYYDVPREPVYASANLRDIAILAGNYVWIAGVFIMFVNSLVSYLKIRKRLKVSILLRENIYIADDIEVPFIMGIFSPKIYLPCGMSGDEQEYVILHETHHIRRFDHIIKAVAFFALCLHWFNPLVWIAFVLACRDMEMSCDEAVMKKVKGDINKTFRAGYSEALLKFAAAGKNYAGTPLAFGEGNIKGRIKNLAKWKRSTVWIYLGAGALCLFLAFCLMTNPYPVTRDPQLYSFDLWGKSHRVETFVELQESHVNFHGGYDSYLFVEQGGKIYRYEFSGGGSQFQKPGVLLDSFTQETDLFNDMGILETVNWEVYSLKTDEDAPQATADETGVMVFAEVLHADEIQTGTDGNKEIRQAVYRYSPSKGVESADEMLKQLMDRYAQPGYVYIKNGVIEAGQDLWLSFICAASDFDPVPIYIISCMTLDPSACDSFSYEIYQEDYPVIEVLTLEHNKANDIWKLGSAGGSSGFLREYAFFNAGSADIADPHQENKNANFIRYTFHNGEEEAGFSVFLRQ